jgi:hypothetical protein
VLYTAAKAKALAASSVLFASKSVGILLIVGV